MMLSVAVIVNSGPEIRNRYTKVPELNPIVAAIAKSGPEIRNHCTDLPGMYPMAAAIAKSWPEIGNHSSAIVSASRMARLRKVIAATMTRLFQIIFAAK